VCLFLAGGVDDRRHKRQLANFGGHIDLIQLQTFVGLGGRTSRRDFRSSFDAEMTLSSASSVAAN
jgi:hypothetical protein